MHKTVVIFRTERFVIELLIIENSNKIQGPFPGYYKQCWDEHWGTHVSFRSGFLSVYAQEWDCWVIWQLYFQFFKESPHCSP